MTSLVTIQADLRDISSFLGRIASCLERIEESYFNPPLAMDYPKPMQQDLIIIDNETIWEKEQEIARQRAAGEI